MGTTDNLRPPNPARKQIRLFFSHPLIEERVARLRAFRQTGLVAAAYTVLALFLTFPLVMHMGTKIPGGGDGYVFLWNLWWIKHAVLTGRWVFYTDRLLYPMGTSLTYHTLTLAHGLMSIPLQLLVGLVSANNLILLGSFVLSGIGTYLLVRHLTGSPGAAFLAGVLFAFCPYRLAHLHGHYNLLGTYWIPFFLFALVKAGDPVRGRFQHAVQAGLFLALTALTEYTYMVFLLIVTFIYILTRPQGLRAVALRRVAMAMLIFALVGVPLTILLLQDFLHGGYGHVAGFGGADTLQADLAAFFLPSPFHPLWGKWVRAAYAGLASRDLIEMVITPGYLCLLLVGLGIWRYGRGLHEWRFWMVIVAVFWLLSLGPFPRWFGRAMPGVTLPFAFLAHVPVVNNIRAPARFTVVATLALAILAGGTLANLLSRVPNRTTRGLLLVICTLAIGFECIAVPIRLFDAKVPAIYEVLSRDRTPGALIEIPFGWVDGFHAVGWTYHVQRYQYYQSLHARPLFSGAISRLPTDGVRAVTELPFVRLFWRMQTGTALPMRPAEGSEELRQFLERGWDTRYVLIHRPFTDQEILAWMTSVLPLQRVASDDDSVLFKVTTPPALPISGVKQADAVDPPASLVGANSLNSPQLLSGQCEEPQVPAAVVACQPLAVELRCTNTGQATWLPQATGGGFMRIGWQWLDRGGRVANAGITIIGRLIRPGDSVAVPLRFLAPPKPGSYWLEMDLVSEWVMSLRDMGFPPVRKLIAVLPEVGAPTAAELTGSRTSPNDLLEQLACNLTPHLNLDLFALARQGKLPDAATTEKLILPSFHLQGSQYQHLPPMALVTAAYRTLLGRDPDPEGKRAFIQAIASGSMDADGLFRAIIGSSEFRERLFMLASRARTESPDGHAP